MQGHDSNQQRCDGDPLAVQGIADAGNHAEKQADGTTGKPSSRPSYVRIALAHGHFSLSRAMTMKSRASRWSLFSAVIMVASCDSPELSS